MDETKHTKKVVGHNVKMMLERIEKAAQEDSARQRSYDNAFDRKKGFIEGAKWAMKEMSKTD